MHSHAQAFSRALDNLVVPCHESPGPRYPRQRRSDCRVHEHTLRSRPTRNRHGCSDSPACAGPAAMSHCEQGTAPRRVRLAPRRGVVSRLMASAHVRSPGGGRRRDTEGLVERLLPVSTMTSWLRPARLEPRWTPRLVPMARRPASSHRQPVMVRTDGKSSQGACGSKSTAEARPALPNHVWVDILLSDHSSSDPPTAVAMMVEGALDTPTSIGMKS